MRDHKADQLDKEEGKGAENPIKERTGHAISHKRGEIDAEGIEIC